MTNGNVNNVVIINDNLGNAFLPEWDMACNIIFNNTKGYYIKVTEPHTFQFFGQINSNDQMITLNQGWDIIPFLFEEPLNPEVALSNILDDIFLVKDVFGNVYYPSMNYNGIGDLKPGQGYQIKMNSSQTLIYSE